MDYNQQLPVKGYIIECKRKDLSGDEATFFLKVNAYQDYEALGFASTYLENNLRDCDVVKIEKSYSKPFLGVIN